MENNSPIIDNLQSAAITSKYDQNQSKWSTMDTVRNLNGWKSWCYNENKLCCGYIVSKFVPNNNSN